MAIWFFLPAGVGNAAAVVAARLPILRRLEAPLDFGLTIRGKRLLGAHKTIRGLLVSIILATFTLWLQRSPLASNFASSTRPYELLPLFVLGPLLGLGAIGGDAVKSFFKRRRGLLPGVSWFPFDQIDYILGALLLTLPFVMLPVLTYVWAIIFWPLTHLVASAFGYMLHLKDSLI